MRKLLLVPILIMGLAVLPRPAAAAEITGTLGIAGGVAYDALDPFGGAIIDFEPLGGGTGQFFNISSISDYFVGLVLLGSSGTILDLTNVLAAAGVPGPAYAPAGVDINVVNFLSNFSTAPGLHFDLTKVLLQGGTACTGGEGLGDTCVLGPFSITQTNQGIRINFDVLGWFRYDPLGDEGFFQGAFSTTFTGMTFPTLFDRLNTGQDFGCGPNNDFSIACSFDANFRNASVPEPLMLTLMGMGFVGAGIAARRRRNDVGK